MDNIRLVIFDINQTLIHSNSWQNFNMALGMTAEEDEVLWKLNQDGILSNKNWTDIVNNLYRLRGKANKENITKALLGYEYIEGAKEAVDYIKQKYKVALISGAPDILVETVAQDLGIDMFGANALLRFNEDDELEEMAVLADEPQSKVIYLQSFCRRLDISENQVAAVGDGANDIELFRRTRHGITFKDSKIETEAWKTIKSLNELRSIL